MGFTISDHGFDSLEAVEQGMKEVVEKYFYKGDFFKTLLCGGYSMEQIRYFAIQYSYYSRHFPRVLGAAISAMAPQSSWWIPLADNLWDEAGRGIPGHAHETLYRTFLHSVDETLALDERGMPWVPMSAAVERAIQTFITFFYQATPLQAMAAVGFGSEFFAGDVMGVIAKGLQHARYNQLHPLDITFWRVHSDEHEPRHYQLCKEVLVDFHDPESLQIMYETGREIAISEATMYAQLHDEMMRL
ncbi:TenA family transcriptional regulator [Sulfoacidibacillus thermotolerans]|uniref:Uncharacterized protein n=1 Tax=Sulfoacidibacillus thermotolerans TaxID=1765684 RepID=A0A2U3D853_SULT2|nr:iron-containing redox enzyme family protein [Sulfoacidibacillus thermotolerans]PWI57457.1 hypothetical protein BM613_08255 [Sulfoacidibacillus thermotolerans]